MKRKQFVLVLIATFIVTVVIGFATRQEAQDKKSQAPTDITRGILTERQRSHSELYKGRRRDTKKLTELTNGSGFVVNIGQEYGSFEFGPQPTLLEAIRDSYCAADAIVLAKAVSNESQLTPDENFIFTDYQFSITQILKDDQSASLAKNPIIVVTRGGGKVRLNGQVIELIDNSEQRIILGDHYLLFLKRVPTTGAYRTTTGATRIDSNGHLQRLNDLHQRENLHGVEVSLAIGLIKDYAADGTCGFKEAK
jgi:hypothetical protein